MQLENQVCSLELAKRLNELGINQHSYFSWYAFENPLQQIFKESDVDEDRWRIGENKACSKGGADWMHSAFTVAELLAILPQRVTLPKEKNKEPYDSFRLRIEKGIWAINPDDRKFSEFYSVNYYCDTTSHALDWIFDALTKNQTDENPADALAKMLIYLIENKLL